MAAIATALVWFSQVSADGTFAVDILGPSILAGAGLGLAFVPDTIAAISGVRPEESGFASGLINTSQQIGGALGLSILATITNARTDDLLAGARSDPTALPVALTEGFQDAFLGGAVIAAVGLIVASVLIRTRDSPAHFAPPAGGERSAKAHAG